MDAVREATLVFPDYAASARCVQCRKAQAEYGSSIHRTAPVRGKPPVQAGLTDDLHCPSARMQYRQFFAWFPGLAAGRKKGQQIPRLYHRPIILAIWAAS